MCVNFSSELMLTAWIVKQRSYMVLSRTFLLDCRLTDPQVPVELHRGKLGDDNLKKVDPQNDPHVTQNGQMFTVDVSTLTFANYMEFECRATGKSGLTKNVILMKPRGLNLQIECYFFQYRHTKTYNVFKIIVLEHYLLLY